MDLCGHISGRPKLCDILLCNRVSHPSALRDGSGHDGKAESNVVEPWVLELGVGEAKEEFGIKKTALGSFIKDSGIGHLLLSLKTCLFLRNLSRRTVGLPMPVLMKILQ